MASGGDTRSWTGTFCVFLFFFTALRSLPQPCCPADSSPPAVRRSATFRCFALTVPVGEASPASLSSGLFRRTARFFGELPPLRLLLVGELGLVCEMLSSGCNWNCSSTAGNCTSTDDDVAT